MLRRLAGDGSRGEGNYAATRLAIRGVRRSWRFLAANAHDTKGDFGSMIGPLVSGGQTGVDRAALDATMEPVIACGWCPNPSSETPQKGRIRSSRPS